MIKNMLISTAIACALSMPNAAQVMMDIDFNNRGHNLNPYQYGIFYEEINHAGEGGLYAEMVQDRSFEGREEDHKAWMPVGNADTAIVNAPLLNKAQKHCMRIKVKDGHSGICNTGFWGMAFEKGTQYKLSFWATEGKYNAQLQTASGTIIASSTAKGTEEKGEWQKFETVLTANDSCTNGRLLISSSKTGTYYIDMVSLMPPTFNGHKNGLRKDLAERLRDLRPTFMRFPGGCYVEGVYSYEEAFRWKTTLGKIEDRPGHYNQNWGYWVSDGMGYDEFLQLCEDIGAAPMFVVNVGLGHEYQIPLDSLDWYIQDALDAIEYANGDATTKWGAVRIRNGHPKPYNLKFIEIGNENYQANPKIHSQQYAERYIRFYKAIKEKYPDIITIGNVDAWGHDNPVWLNLHPVEIIDEHYYRSHYWMRNNYTKYDNRMRNFIIYNGEYAANGGGKGLAPRDINGAIGEAIYMLGMERNSDICKMASFAPIFMNVNNPRWKYDLIYYNSARHFVTPSYYVQQIFATNVGDYNLNWTETGNETELDTATAKEVSDKRLVYQSVAVDKGKRLIYVKTANPNNKDATVKINWKNIKPLSATVEYIKASRGEEANSMEEPEHISPKTKKVESTDLLHVPAYSVCFFKIKY